MRKSIKYYPASQSQKIHFIRDFYDLRTINSTLTLYIEVFNYSALKKTFEILIRRHAIFRTTLVRVNNEVKQRVWMYKRAHFIIDIIDIRTITVKEETINKVYQSSVTKRFKSDQFPWLDIKLVQVKENYSILITALPHMIVDAQSIEIIRHEICKIYTSLLTGEKLHLSTPFQYKDYITEADALLKTEKGERHRKYWIKLLKEPPLTNISTYVSEKNRTKSQPYKDSIREEMTKSFHSISEIAESDFIGNVSFINYSEGKAFQFYLDQRRFAIVKKLSKETQVGIPVVIIATFHILLFKLTGEKDVITGVNTTLRDNDNVNSIIGFLVNTILFRYKVEDSWSLIHYIRCLNIRFLESLTHRVYPHELALYDSDISLQQIGIFFLNIVKHENITIGDIEPELVHLDYNTSPYFDIDCDIAIYENTAGIKLRYKTEIFNRSAIESIFLNYLKLVDYFELDLYVKIGDIFLEQPNNKQNILGILRSV